MLDAQLDAASPAPVAEAEPLGLFNLLAVAQIEVEGPGGFVVGSLLPAQSAVVGVLGLDGDGGGREVLEDGLHDESQGVEVGQFLTGVFGDLFVIRLAGTHGGPRDVVEEEVGAGKIGRDLNGEGIGLDVVQVCLVAEEAQAFTGLVEGGVLLLGGGDCVRGQLIDVVEFFGDDADGFAVAGILRPCPGFLYWGKAAGHVRVGLVEEFVERFLGGTSDKQVCADIVLEELAEDVRILVEVGFLAPHMFVRVDERGLLDEGDDIGLWRHGR